MAKQNKRHSRKKDSWMSWPSPLTGGVPHKLARNLNFIEYQSSVSLRLLISKLICFFLKRYIARHLICYTHSTGTWLMNESSLIRLKGSFERILNPSKLHTQQGCKYRLLKLKIYYNNIKLTKTGYIPILIVIELQ